MAIEKLPAGTRGGGSAPGWLNRILMPIMLRVHRRQGDTFSGMELLYLTTTGARSGQQRKAPVARFDDAGGWLVVASAGGAVGHPGWYHNLCAHPDQVWVEFGGQKHKVSVTQLEGAEREQAWAKVVAKAPRFDGYTAKTDRMLPVLRLTPVAG